VGLADPQAMVVVEACAAAFDRVGLPEGLYPLAHATIYLAGTEKSNSSLGFFDALKSVRSTYRQDVPTHLRDAHRDKSAFGDGAGYRYPHAYAEHWVAQQYLPDDLQGEVFWRPGPLGWEGQLQDRLQQRRAAQLAAAAELALDQPELLSSGPDDPLLRRWVQRQAVAEGERLDRLRQRFWRGACLRRLDRVLILEAHSLLWALDPLLSTEEGEVVICVADDSARERIQAQLVVLDQLRRPRILPESSDRQDSSLHLLLEQEGSERFEWIAGRQPFRQLPEASWDADLEQLTRLAAPDAQARFLFTRPQLGPVALLLLHRSRTADSGSPGEGKGDRESLSLLESVAPLESGWIEPTSLPVSERIGEGLRSRGWRVELERWEESISLPLNEALLQRWLQHGAPFRNRLEEQLGAKDAQALVQQFRQELGSTLVQTLEHTLLTAKRVQAPRNSRADAKRKKKAPVDSGGPRAEA
jgi:putative ATPase